MKNFLKWGLIIVMVNVVLNLIGLATSDPTEMLKTGEQSALSQGLYWGAIIISLVCLFLGIKEKRDTDPSDFTFGRGWVEGLLISLIGAVFSAIWVYIFFAFVSPDLLDAIREQAIIQMQQNQMSPDELEKATSMMDLMFSPTSFAIWTIVMYALGGMFFSLIFSAIVNSGNKNAETPATA
jgi:Trk-type K+ transport system membrane component